MLHPTLAMHAGMLVSLELWHANEGVVGGWGRH